MKNNPVIGWFKKQVRRLRELKDHPKAIARGVAIGMYFGFSPLFGLKTLLSVLVAWMFRSSKLAAVIAVTLHDVFLPFFPLLLRFEYIIGYWILSSPHRMPPRLLPKELHLEDMMKWTTFLDVGGPMLLGAALLAIPFAFLAYWGTLLFLRRADRIAHPHSHHENPDGHKAASHPPAEKAHTSQGHSAKRGKGR